MTSWHRGLKLHNMFVKYYGKTLSFEPDYPIEFWKASKGSKKKKEIKEEIKND